MATREKPKSSGKMSSPGKLKAAVGDIEDLESGDPTRLMPRLRKIHKLGSRHEIEDLGAEFQSPGTIRPNEANRHEGKEKDSFGLGDLYPNVGEGRRERPVTWKPKKLKFSTLDVDDSSDLDPGQMRKGGGVLKHAYKLQGHTEVGGLRIAIENRKGSVRSGKSREGVEWRTKMKNPYGYIVGTEGKDGEAVDAYVGPKKDADKAYVVHQHKSDGTGYDEDKVMLAFPSKKAAKEAFLKHYDSDKFLGPISVVTMERLRKLVQSKKRLVKISHVQGMVDEIVRLSR